MLRKLNPSKQLHSGKISKGLKKFLKKVVIDGGLQDQIAVADAALGKAIKVRIVLFYTVYVMEV